MTYHRSAFGTTSGENTVYRRSEYRFLHSVFCIPCSVFCILYSTLLSCSTGHPLNARTSRIGFYPCWTGFLPAFSATICMESHPQWEAPPYRWARGLRPQSRLTQNTEHSRQNTGGNKDARSATISILHPVSFILYSTLLSCSTIQLDILIYTRTRRTISDYLPCASSYSRRGSPEKEKWAFPDDFRTLLVVPSGELKEAFWEVRQAVSA